MIEKYSFRCLGRRYVLAIAAIIFSFFSSQANIRIPEVQNYDQTVTGTVLGPQGMPLPGVNILEKGTSNGTMTDFEGNFSLEVKEEAVLVVS